MKRTRQVGPALLAAMIFAAGVSCSRGLEAEHSARAQPGHKQGVTAVAFVPDGRWLVSGGGEGTLRIWETSSGRELRIIEAHKPGVTSVAVSPDGRLVASSGLDKTIKLWDVTTGREVRTLSGHVRDVFGVAFTADGLALVSLGRDRRVKVWDLQTGQELRQFDGGLNDRGYFPFYSAAISPDGRWVALAGGRENRIKIWDTQTGRETKQITLRPEQWPPFPTLSFSPDNRRLALVAGSSDTVMFLDVKTGRVSGKELPRGSERRTWSLGPAFSPDGRWLAATANYSIELWDLQGPVEPRLIHGHASAIPVIAFSPDGKLLATGSYDHTIKLWEVATGRLVRMLGTPAEPREPN